MKDLLSRNLMELRGQIADACEESQRDADDISIVAITKTRPAAVIKTAVAAGLCEIGESRVQEAESKITELGPIARYHLVGHLQTNKVKKAVALFDVIQSVDSFKLAWEINRQAGLIDRTIECYVQLNSSGESHKFGTTPEDCLNLVRQVQALDNIRLTGLMTVGPRTDDDVAIRQSFRLSRQLFCEAREIFGADFVNLSMGMSGDFALAITEGATMIRVGTGLFGPRVPA